MPWNPDLYLKFSSERFQPFEDLLHLIPAGQYARVADLGCGSGELTAQLAARLSGSEVVGFDNSPEMLHQATRLIKPGLKFKLGSIEDFAGSWDFIFSNAAYHWVADHAQLFERLWQSLNPGGCLLAQFPSGHRNPAHKVLAQTAAEEPFRTALNGWEWNFPVLSIEQYAEMLHNLGGVDLVVFDKVYPHVLRDADAVYDFTSGTSLLPYLEHLPSELHDQFKQAYLEKLQQHWQSSPVFFGFRRILLRAVKKA